MNMQLGYEIFHATPGQVDKMACRVCGSNCDVKRDLYVPANFVMALAQVSDLYDVFSCPLANKEWHREALRLVLEIEKAPGKSVAELIKQDLTELLKANGR